MDERMKHLNTDYPSTGRHHEGTWHPATSDDAVGSRHTAVRLAEVEQQLAQFEDTLAEAFELLAEHGGDPVYRDRARQARREASRARRIAERERRFALNGSSTVVARAS